MKNQLIPQDWTVEQADAVFMFLAGLTDAVWEAHEKALVEQYIKDELINVYLEEEIVHEGQYADEGFHDDIPF